MRKNKGMKQFKKIPKLLMVGMMLVTSIGLNTIDISASTGTMNVETNNNWNRETRDPNYQVWGAYGLITVSGATAFCLESRVLAQSGVTVTQGDPSEVGISIAKAKRMALIQYFGMRLGTGNDYAITQSALWNELGSLEYVSSSSNSSWDSTVSYIDTINQKINRYYTKPSTNNKSYEMNVGESMTITDTNDVLKDYDITSTGGLQVTKNGNSITITALVSSDDNATINFTNRITKELSSSNTNVIYKRAGNQTVGSFSATDPIYSRINVKVNKFGTLNITKQDEDGKLVPNTKFKLSYNANMSNPIGTVTTGANGTVSYDKLLPQTVYIQEIGVPKHLVLDSTVKSAKVISNSTVAHTATNKWVKGKVKIRKIDSESGKQVEGATYGIFNEENKEIQRFVTTRNGYIESGYLRFGNYYVKEVIAPTGYLLNETKYPFTISTNEQKVDITGSDLQAKGRINLEKQDTETGSVAQGNATLDGAEYGLYAKENILDIADNDVLYTKGQLVDKVTTKNGKATINNLYLGSYFVKELTPPTGYLIDTKEYPITLSYQNQNTSVVSIDKVVKDDVKKGKISVHKIVDRVVNKKTAFRMKGLRSEIKKPLEGVEFKITQDKTGNLVDTLKTDKEGYDESKLLPYGWYTVSEQEVKGYETLAPFKVFVNEDGKTFNYYIENKAIVTKLTIVKKDLETGKTIPVSGIKFKIQDSKGNYVKQHIDYPYPMDIDEYETSKYGSVTLPQKLTNDTYKIVEVEGTVPVGYLLNLEGKEIVLDGKQAEIQVTFENKPVKGKIVIEKQAELLSGYDFRATEHGLLYEPIFEKGLLKDVTYGIYAREDVKGLDGTEWYKKGALVKEYTTDGKIKLESDELPLGAYTLKEKTTVNGYVIDKKSYDFDLTYENEKTPLIVHTEKLWNDKQRGFIEFTKDIEDSEYQDIKDTLKGIQFGLFARESIKDVNGEELVPVDGMLAVVQLDETLKASFEVDVEGKYYVQELSTDGKYVLDDEQHDFEFKYSDENKKQTELKFNDEVNIFVNKLKRGSVEIMKTDNSEEKKPLEGVTFELSDTKEFKKILSVAKTDNKGKALFQDLELNTYYIREKATLPSFVLSDKIFEVEIKENKEIVKIEMENELRLSSILIRKKDTNSKKPLKDVEFTLFDKDMKALKVNTTDGAGNVEFKELKNGVYYVQETKALDGYKISDKKIEFIIEGNDEGKVYESEMENELRLSSILIRKKDTNSKKPLKDVEFTLFDKDMKALKVNTTDGAGNVEFKELKNGVYYVQETKALDGYKISDKKIEFIIEGNDEGKVYESEMENELRLSSILIRKKDTNSKKPLKDVEFTLFDKDMKALKVNTTDGAGNVEFKELKNGMYYVQETKALDGYKASDHKIKFVIEGNDEGKVYESEVFNELLPVITKVPTNDDTNAYMLYCVILGALSWLLLLVYKKKRSY